MKSRMIKVVEYCLVLTGFKNLDKSFRAPNERGNWWLSSSRNLKQSHTVFCTKCNTYRTNVGENVLELMKLSWTENATDSVTRIEVEKVERVHYGRSTWHTRKCYGPKLCCFRWNQNTENTEWIQLIMDQKGNAGLGRMTIGISRFQIMAGFKCEKRILNEISPSESTSGKVKRNINLWLPYSTRPSFLDAIFKSMKIRNSSTLGEQFKIERNLDFNSVKRGWTRC